MKRTDLKYWSQAESDQYWRDKEKQLNLDLNNPDHKIAQLKQDRDNLLIRIAKMQTELHNQYDPMGKTALKLRTKLENRINELDQLCDEQQREIQRLNQIIQKLTPQ